MSDLWWLCAIFSSILTGAMIYANQIFKMPSSLMMTYRGLVQSILLLPFFAFFEMPTDPMFWIFGTLQGLMIAYSDKRLFLCSRIYGGEIAASLKPYIIVFVFILWLIIKPEDFFALCHNPLRFATITLCLLGVSFSLNFTCKAKAGKEAFTLMLPSLIVFSLIDINNKYVTTLGATSGLPSAIFYYCWITGIWCGLPNFIHFCRHKNWRLMFLPRYIAGGMLVIFCLVTSNIFKNSAMFYAQNPAYVSAIMSLYPVWILIWNYFYYRKSDSEKFPKCNPYVIVLMLASVITLIIIK